jgi:hypothetical protein
MLFPSWCAVSLRSTFLVSVPFAIAACGPAGPAALTPDVVAGIRSTRVTSYIPQERLTVQEESSNSLIFLSSSNIATIGIGTFVNAMKQKQAEAAASQISNAINDVDFRRQFWAAVPSVTKEIPWLKAAEPKTSPIPFSIVTASRVSEASALVLSTGYALSQGCQRFVTATTIRFYLQGQNESEAAVSSIEYSSADIGSEDEDQAISLWIANNGAAYRKAVTESIAESTKMLRYALGMMGGNPPEAQRRVKLYQGSLATDVSIIEETEERVLLQGADGQFLSVAAKDVNFGDQPSLYARRRAQDAQERERRRSLDEQSAWEASDPAGAKYWTTWSAAHPGDACASALASLRSASACVSAACSEPLVLTAGYQRKCQPDPETRVEVHKLRRRWQKELGGGASD